MKNKFLQSSMAFFAMITLMFNLLSVSAEAGDQTPKKKPFAGLFKKKAPNIDELAAKPAATSRPSTVSSCTPAQCCKTRVVERPRIVYKDVIVEVERPVIKETEVEYPVYKPVPKIVEVDIPVYRPVPRVIDVDIPVYKPVVKEVCVDVPVYKPVAREVAVPIPVYAPQPVQTAQYCPPPAPVCPPGSYPVINGYTHVRTWSDGRQQVMGYYPSREVHHSGHYSGQVVNVQMPRQVRSDYGNVRYVAPPQENCNQRFIQHGGHPQGGFYGGQPNFHGGHQMHPGVQHGGGNYDRAMSWGHHVVNNAYGIGYGIGTRAYDVGRNW